jgi:hypothetical protein
MISVNSSVIRAVDYDGDNSILYIKFNSGTTYKYYRVPEAIFRGLLNSQSKGTYFNQRIKDRFRAF